MPCDARLSRFRSVLLVRTRLVAIARAVSLIDVSVESRVDNTRTPATTDVAVRVAVVVMKRGSGSASEMTERPGRLATRRRVPEVESAPAGICKPTRLVSADVHVK